MTAHLWDWSNIVSPDLVERALAHEDGSADQSSRKQRKPKAGPGAMTRAIATA
jgi:hypothetical protein